MGPFDNLKKYNVKVANEEQPATFLRGEAPAVVPWFGSCPLVRLYHERPVPVLFCLRHI